MIYFLKYQQIVEQSQQTKPKQQQQVLKQKTKNYFNSSHSQQTHRTKILLKKVKRNSLIY